MRKRILLVTAATVATIVACSDDTTAGPKTTTFTATLSGANEVPVKTTAASGAATLTMIGSTVSYTVNGSGFATVPTQGHIHIGAAGVVGPPIVNFTINPVTSGVIASGTFSVAGALTLGSVTISGDSMRVLLDNGTAYVNLHTAANPGGEIRGQIIRQ